VAEHAIAETLAACDWVVYPGYLDTQRCAVLRAEAESLRAAGCFRAAGIGQVAERRGDIRSDELLWIEPELAPQASTLLQREFEALRLAVNAATFLGLHEFEGHYAAYPSGASYARHLDQFRGDGRRVVSVVLYLNEAWGAADGGELKLYPENGEAVMAMPVAGTLVCFLSDRLPHEVLPARRLRLSLTGWFRRRD
jgi:SM-20-related protein